ncbi:MAG: hypothetical protein IH866_05210 [Chloroflexi bacterium]|nr:hypothetical protein [Chloroflexota bacterium]
MQTTAIVVGPGGVGKGPLDFLFRPDVTRIDPYRLRPGGPRGEGPKDPFYANPRIREELLATLSRLGDKPRRFGSIEWLQKSNTLFFDVRGERQMLLLGGCEGRLAKAEIFAPTLSRTLSHKDLKGLFGMTKIIVLNPASETILTMRSWGELEEATQENCKRRGDSEDTVKRRVDSIAAEHDAEAPAWRKLIEKHCAKEVTGWEFPEHLYKNPAPGGSLVDHQNGLLGRARERLLSADPSLAEFLKTPEEIAGISEPVA